MHQGRHFSFFQGGKNLTDFLGGGQNMKNTQICRQNHQKVTIFQNQAGGTNAPPAPPYPSPNYIPAMHSKIVAKKL